MTDFYFIKQNMTRLIVGGRMVPVTRITPFNPTIYMDDRAVGVRTKSNLRTKHIKKSFCLTPPQEDYMSALETTFDKDQPVEIKWSSISKGKGFAGCIKRHGFRRQAASHGGRATRRPGALGGRKGKVIKGKKMPGRMGGIRSTQIGKMIKITNEYFVLGSVAGNRNCTVRLSVV